MVKNSYFLIISMLRTKIKKSQICWNFTICWLFTHKKGAWPWTWWIGYENGVNVTFIFLGINGGTRSSMIAVLMKKLEKAIDYNKKSYLSNRWLRFILQVKILTVIIAFCRWLYLYCFFFVYKIFNYVFVIYEWEVNL